MVGRPSGTAPADDGHVRERAGWAPLRHFAGRSALGLLVVLGIGLGFGLLLVLVRAHWSPLLNLDRGVAQRLNDLVAPRPAAVDALTVVSRLGGRPVML